MRGPTNWLVALSRGDSVAPIVDTGCRTRTCQTYSGLDVDGDGLEDFLLLEAGLVRPRLRRGQAPDLLLAASDGFGVQAKFTYGR